MDSSVVQVLYIIVGILFTQIIERFPRIILPLINCKKINYIHLGYCIVAPVVLWQFVYQQSKFFPKDDLFDGLLLLLSLFCLAGISSIVYPKFKGEKLNDPKGWYCYVENPEYAKYTKDQRRYFYLLLFIYLLINSIMPWMIKGDYLLSSNADSIRIAMCFLALFLTFFDFSSKYKFTLKIISTDMRDKRYHYWYLDVLAFCLFILGFILFTIFKVQES